MALMSLVMWYLASIYAAAALTPAIAPATGAVVPGQLMWYDNDALVGGTVIAVRGNRERCTNQEPFAISSSRIWSKYI
jgi:hypothetical protein